MFFLKLATETGLFSKTEVAGSDKPWMGQTIAGEQSIRRVWKSAGQMPGSINDRWRWVR